MLFASMTATWRRLRTCSAASKPASAWSSTPSELPRHRDALILDVRNHTEHAEGAIPGARQLHADRLPWTLNDLPRDREIVVHCQGGARSAAAASLLRAEGFNVTELAGGYVAWEKE